MQSSSNYTVGGKLNDAILPDSMQGTNGNALGSRTGTICEPAAAMAARSGANRKRLLGN